MNMLEATLERSNGGLTAKIGSAKISVGNSHPGLDAYAGKDVIVGIRPEHLEDAALSQGNDERLHGKVVLREALGSEIMVHFVVDAKPALTEQVRELAEDVGEAITEQANETTMVARFNARSRVKVDDTTDVAVDTSALHFFDPETGLGIYDGTTRGRAQ